MYRKTKYSNLIVDITIAKAKDNKYRVIGHAINPEDETFYSEISSYSSRPVIAKRREAAAAEVTSKIERHFYDIYGDGVANHDDMKKAFEAIKREVNDGLRLKPDWKALSTNVNALKFFERNTLQYIIPYANCEKSIFMPEDQRDIQEAILQVCIRHMGGDKNDPSTKEKALEAAKKHLIEADIILAHMREKDPRIPDIILSTAEFGKIARREEQTKMLDINVLYRFYEKLYSYVDSEPDKVFYSVFVVFGLRPAEAAARKPNEIKYYDDYCIVHITTQEKNGEIISRLKNSYSRRILVIPFWGMSLLKICSKKMEKISVAENEAIHTAAECSLWVKQQLLECGANESAMQSLGETICNDDLDDDCIANNRNFDQVAQNRKKKIASYVLRRCFATIMRNYMGFTLFETDRMLGHIPANSGTKAENIDFNSPDMQKIIAKKMERFIFDNRFSRNPSVMPIQLEKERITLIEFSEYRIVNNTNKSQKVCLNFEAAEMGEIIEIDISDCLDQNQLTTLSTPKSWDNLSRTVIGDTTVKK